MKEENRKLRVKATSMAWNDWRNKSMSEKEMELKETRVKEPLILQLDLSWEPDLTDLKTS